MIETMAADMTSGTTKSATKSTTRSATSSATKSAARAPGDVSAGLALLDRAGADLLAAARAQTTTDRYLHAHLSAQRAAGALVAARPARRVGRAGAARGRLRGRDGRVVGVWDQLRLTAPEFAEWADYLAVCGRRRLDLEAGGGPAGSREADDLLRDAETFGALVRAALGLPVERPGVPLVVAARTSP